MPILAPEERLLSHQLGDHYAYWWKDSGHVHWARHAPGAFRSFPTERRRVDPVSALAILSFQHLALDRTVLQGLQRVPWFGEVDSRGVTRFAHAPPHGSATASAEELAQILLSNLSQEIRGYCEGANTVYVLLSGGMDSRVLAATLKHLQASGEVDAPIEAVTWGVDDCRDVHYAERICDYLEWPWHHAPLTSDTYWESFERGALRLGAEVDPKHLHRTDWFEHHAAPGSVVLAASYGDMVGRAEFSHVHLTNLEPLTVADRSRLLAPSARRWATPLLEADLCAPRGRYGNRSEIGWLEIGRHVHYTRRLLGNTLNVINQYCQIEQAFVALDVFGTLWKYAPACRTDEVYTRLLHTLDPRLLDIAWARTGARYDSEEGSDDLRIDFHRYGYWLRRDHAGKLGELLFGDDTLKRLQIFDVEQVAWMFDEWQRERLEDNTSLGTQLSWLAALTIAAREFDIGPPRYDSKLALDPRDRIREYLMRTAARGSQVARRVSRPARMSVLSRLRH